ncbi:MAG: ATP-dependent DNA helicase RecQ [Spirosomataceae bacterium]
MATPEEILENTWGYTHFRPLQKDIIESVLAGNDTLALLPTGGGKSICFQVPALDLDGVCLVITPLIALMKDQVEQLKRRNVLASAIYAGLSPTEVDYTLDNCIYGQTKFLYLSPERLQSELVKVRAQKMKIGLLVIDEAHCISQWGHDFRPPYLQIHAFRDAICPETPIIAVTATATHEVRADIIRYLGMREPRVFVQSFSRENLVYSAIEVPNKEKKLLEILQKVPGSAIVYTKSRKRTVEVAQFLKKYQISSEHYHAGLPTTERFAKQQRWIVGETRVIVSTNAFGMGIDKPDVRIVVHMDFSDTLESYYQESGRAGRDQQKAFAVCLFQRPDIEMALRTMEKRYPEIQLIKHTYQCLCNYYKLALGSISLESFDFDLQDFCTIYGLNPTDTHYVLKVLQDQNVLTLSDAYYSPSKLSLLVSPAELYDLQVRSPKLEKFTKVLLRMYGGELMGNYVRISESAIAGTYFAQTQEIEQILTHLQEVGVADYQKQKSKPQLTFLTSRQDAQNLALDIPLFQQKKQLDFQKLTHVIKYLETTETCRMLYLQKYFDEITEKTCGKCDNCRRQVNRQWEIEKQLQFKQSILDLLPCTMDEIMQSSLFQDKEKLKLILKELIDKEEVQFTQLGFLQKK